MKATALAQCPCQNCNAIVEFETKDVGRSGPCPSCGTETQLLLPPKTYIPVDADSQTQTPPREKKKRGVTFQVVMSLAFFIIGGIIAADGWSNEVIEERLKDASAIRQIVNTIQMCSGLVLMALGTILWTIARLIAKE